MITDFGEALQIGSYAKPTHTVHRPLGRTLIEARRASVTYTPQKNPDTVPIIIRTYKLRTHKIGLKLGGSRPDGEVITGRMDTTAPP